jgi:hypothetical protein
MKTLLKIISATGLLFTLFPSFLVFSGIIEIAGHKLLMLAGTILWFSTAPFWLGRKAPLTEQKP